MYMCRYGNLADVNKSTQWLKKVGPDNTEARSAGAGSGISGLYEPQSRLTGQTGAETSGRNG